MEIQFAFRNQRTGKDIWVGQLLSNVVRLDVKSAEERYQQASSVTSEHRHTATHMRVKRVHILLVMFVVAICAIPFRATLRRPAIAAIQVFRGRKTVADRVGQFGPTVRQRLASDFERIGVNYPPSNMVLVGLKQEKLLEVWVSDPPKFLASYPILGASGTLGPKLQEGDRQVPEGLYRIESLNPNSLYHLALRVNYPNAYDKVKGTLEGRKDLGSDIMIHGKDCSIGCLAMGDEAAEDLFVLAAESGIENISVILSPVDFRSRELPEGTLNLPEWTQELYASIRRNLHTLQTTR